MTEPILTDSQASQPMMKSSGSQSVEPSEDTQSMTIHRQQPIPPPSEPMQFRAIGLVQGTYQPSDERFNRGTLEVEGGLQLDAVLLGQVLSLVKKYIDLERPYFWVVYPRTREKEQLLHLQIVGVWSADGFGPITGEEEPQSLSEQALSEPIEDGYFSIRGQVVYQAQDKQLLYVKIQQAPRKSKERGERAKAFKLRISGTLPQKAVGYFWDLRVRRQGSDLILENGTSIAQMPIQKSQRPQQRSNKPYPKMPYSIKPNRAYRTQANSGNAGGGGVNREARPVPKPIKRQSNPSS